MKKYKKIMAALLTLITILTIPVTEIKVSASTSTDNNYLVLIQNKNGWIAYENMVEKNISGNLIVKAYATSKALNIDYKKTNSNSFTIRQDKKLLTFTKGKQVYKYNNGTTTLSKTAVAAPYTSEYLKANMIHYANISNLIFTQYYTGSKATEYKILGYKGIICYSTIGVIKSIPNIGSVINGSNLGTTDTADKENLSDKTILIGDSNIVFPTLDNFETNNIATDRWGSGNESEAAINKFHDYIPTVTGDKNTGFVDYGNTLDMTISDSTSPNISLKKDDDCYKITLYASLVETNTEDKDYGFKYAAKLNRETLLIYASLISSTPTKLYEVIYDSFEGEEKYKVNSTSFKTVGDFQIKYTVASNKQSVTYIIKAK